jgi:Domain of unknown function (DUF4376)
MYSVLVDASGVELDHISTVDRYIVRQPLHWLESTLAPERPYSVTDSVWSRIKEIRDGLQNEGVKITVSGVDYWFHSDLASRLQHMGLTMMGANMPQGILWKTMSGAMVTMTPQLAGSIFMAVAVLDTTVFGIAEYHRTTMLASPDPTQYDYTVGWPAGFNGVKI